jgi:hypothetical protein
MSKKGTGRKSGEKQNKWSVKRDLIHGEKRPTITAYLGVVSVLCDHAMRYKKAYRTHSISRVWGSGFRV